MVTTPAIVNSGSDRLGKIYFIANGENDLIKIGFTSDIGKRFADLKTGSPVSLTLIDCVPALKSTERWIHAFLKDQRSYGEWFEEDDLLALFQGEICEWYDDTGYEECGGYLTCQMLQELTSSPTFQSKVSAIGGRE